MSRLPTLRVKPSPDWQAARLARWLHEWEIDSALREAAEDDGTEGRGRPPAGAAVAAEERAGPSLEAPRAGESPGPAGRDAGLEPGQIRLLHPDGWASRTRLVYVAILAEDPSRGVLAAPFGRFAEPAFGGELLTGRESPALRVLCVWNARWLPRGLAGRSWKADDLAPAELRDALELLGSLEAGGAVPAGLAQRVGPPLAHMMDPRGEYKAEERLVMDRLEEDGGLSAGGGSPQPSGGPPPSPRAFTAGPEEEYGTRRGEIGAECGRGGLTWPTARESAEAWACARAAESRELYGRAIRFRVRERDVMIEAVADTVQGRCRVSVFDAQERLSTVLDGSRLQAESGELSAPIRTGTLVVPPSLVRLPLALITPDGTCLRLEPAS